MASIPREEQVTICKVVAQAILADGRIADDERMLLDQLMERYELSSAESRDVLARNIDDDPSKLAVGIDSAEGKNALIVELAMAVAADGGLSRAEKQLLETIADVVGVPREELDELVKTALM